MLRIDLRIEAEIESILALVRRYRDLPMSLADACLVRLAELQHPCRVLTFDSEFDIYRRDGRHALDTSPPPRP